MPIAWQHGNDNVTLLHLRGKRIASGFKGAPLFHYLYSGGLANGGLTYDDVKKVPFIGLRQHWNGFKQGKIDAAMTKIRANRSTAASRE